MMDKRLSSINISTTMCLGTKLTMTAEQIINKMSDEQVRKMFNENIDVQYILLDSQRVEMTKNSTQNKIGSKFDTSSVGVVR